MSRRFPLHKLSIREQLRTPVGVLVTVLVTAPGGRADLTLKDGPYLQWGTQNAITVLWETTSPADSTLRFGRGDAWDEVTAPAPVTIHEIRLEGLRPGEIVAYSVRSRAGDEEVASDVFAFQTAPAEPQDFDFVVWGDNQGNPAVFGTLVDRMVEHGPSLAVSVGDVVDDGTVYAQWGRELLTPLGPLASFAPFYVAIGNHERNAHWFYDFLAQPGNEHWFSFDYAGCHFVVLDTNVPFGPGSEQYRWAEADLFSEAAQSSRWLFTFHHHPPYSEIFEETKYAQVRSFLVPLFEAAGVDVNFTGHIHDYERGVYVPPATGRRIAYVQTSGGGGRLWQDEFGGDWPQIQKVVQFVHHYCHIELTGDTLTLRAIGHEGREEIDRVILIRAHRGERPGDAAGGAISQWDFTSGDLSASFGPGRLRFRGGVDGMTAALTEFGSTSFFGIPGPRGADADVMKFPSAVDPALGFVVEPGAAADHGGGKVNDYTLVFDLLIPGESFAADSFLALYNTNPGNTDDADFFVRLPAGGIGIAGRYQGRIEPDTWHRIAVVHRLEGARAVLRKYIDGDEVGFQFVGARDGRWALHPVDGETPWFLLFTDDSGDTTEGYLSGFSFVDRGLTAAEVALLGGADVDGIFVDPCVEDVACPPQATRFRRGDANTDGAVTISDALFVLGVLFEWADDEIHCPSSADTDDNGALELADPVFLLRFLFSAGAAPAAPYPACGLDATPDGLGCAVYAPCGG